MIEPGLNGIMGMAGPRTRISRAVEIQMALLYPDVVGSADF